MRLRGSPEKKRRIGQVVGANGKNQLEVTGISWDSFPIACISSTKHTVSSPRMCQLYMTRVLHIFQTVIRILKYLLLFFRFLETLLQVLYRIVSLKTSVNIVINLEMFSYI